MGRMFTFDTVYALNNNQLTFIDKILDKLTEFKEGALILGGDFNVNPDPTFDTSHRGPSHSFVFLKYFRKTLQTHLSVDSWSVLDPNDRDFSYYSKVHDVYTRIDLLCVDHPTLEILQSSSIENITISDYAPVMASLALPFGNHRAWSWQLNENLLNDTAVVARVTDVLTH